MQVYHAASVICQTGIHCFNIKYRLALGHQLGEEACDYWEGSALSL